MNKINSEVEIIEISEYKKGIQIPKGKKYRFKVGRHNFISDTESKTGKEILEVAGKEPFANFQLFQNFQDGGSKPVEYEEVVYFTEPGIEKFRTIPKDPTDGCS